ncbi:MAG: hypothetical protein BGO82_14870 [Devosia sp. 67-54]|uniref:PIN domain-containing protein n=1 Tax=unclassified Devosia TaxID=196773 RepID=UPI00095B164D|nr:MULTISPECIES: PIN domain-containing protein [unclassified Devosia]MBN9303650.1 PIN domain-containing protein [Devosia sp.]OJX17533.1 MAG: hypothetical protein BGO82_14870 [Devosia sp. 67-54]
MPGASVFIDSNTFLYTLDEAERDKCSSAKVWLNTLTIRNSGVTNLQVLNEVTNVITRKIAKFGSDDPFFRVDAFAAFGSNPLTNAAGMKARALFLRYRYAWWDCLLLASALELGCTHFLSEDLQDGQRIAISPEQSLTIINPFAHSPEQILSR